MEVLRYVTESGKDVFGRLARGARRRAGRGRNRRPDRPACGRQFRRLQAASRGRYASSYRLGAGLPSLLRDGWPDLRPAAVRRRQAEAVGRHQAGGGILEGFSTEDSEAMTSKASISHDEAVVRRLRENPKFAVEYLKAALDDADEPKVLLTHCVASPRPRGGVAKVAKAAGVERESLYRACLPRQSASFDAGRRHQSRRAKANGEADRPETIDVPQPFFSKIMHTSCRPGMNAGRSGFLAAAAHR